MISVADMQFHPEIYYRKLESITLPVSADPAIYPALYEEDKIGTIHILL
jgi:hypothetical protein